MKKFHLSGDLQKYKYAAVLLLLGVVLLLLPTGRAETKRLTAEEEGFDRAAVQSEMETLLRGIDGAGRLRLMLSVESSTQRELAQDVSRSADGAQRSEEEIETVVRSVGSGTQEVVVTRVLYPRYLGAVVVCEGADNAAVRLNIVRAVGALTGLSSDKISVVRGKP